MKRLLLLLMAVLLLPMPGLSTEPAAQTQIVPPDGTSVVSQCLYQGQLWFLSAGGGVFAWDGETMTAQEKTTVPDAHNLWLVAAGDTLYGMDTMRFTLHTLHNANGPVADAAPISLEPVTFSDPGDEYSMPAQVLVREHTLYILYRPQSLGGYGTRLTAWDITTGALTDVQAPEHLQAVAVHPEGLLGLVQDAEQYAMTGDAALSRASLVLFGEGNEKELSCLQQPVEPHEAAMVVNKQGDVLYVSGSKLYLHTFGGQERLAAYLPNAWFMEGTGDWLVAAGEQAGVLSANGLTIVSTAPGAADRPLTIYGMTDKGGAHMRALEQLDGVPVDYIDASWGDDTYLGQLLASSAGALDVLYLDAWAVDTNALIDKGYCLNLGGSEIIKAHLKRCYPILQAEAMRGDSIFLVPVYLDAGAIQAKPERFARLGLDIPRTFEDLCSFLQMWADEAPDGNIIPITWNAPKRFLRQEALRTAYAALMAQGEAFSFEAPLVRELLAMTEGLNLQALEWGDEDYGKFHQPNMLQKTNLSLPSLTMSAMDDPEDRAEVLLLAPDENTPAGFPVQVGWLAVYGKPGREQDAIRYVEQYIEALDDATRIMLYPDENTPLQPEGIEDAIERLTQETKELEKQMETAQGDTKATLETRLADKRELLAYQIAQRYTISPEVIAQYRALMEHAVLENRTMTQILSGSEFTTPMIRWQQGQMTLEQYLREAEGKLRLMRLEAQ